MNDRFKPPRQFEPVQPGWEDRIRENLGMEIPGVIESDTRYPGAPAPKQLAVDHYRVQGDAARWELYGERLIRALTALTTSIQWHVDGEGVCEVCQDTAYTAHVLLQEIQKNLKP